MPPFNLPGVGGFAVASRSSPAGKIAGIEMQAR